MLKKISNRLSCYICNIEVGDFYKIFIYNTRVVTTYGNLVYIIISIVVSPM